ncbi:MAG TPA: glycine C-acetyltransferase [Spirochaetia bacterium]|nr:glycine C-acetyltransferase [Spirochaetia bacterium]
MLDEGTRAELRQTIQDIQAAGTLKAERVLGSPQGARISVRPGREVLNLCANNYLGLASHPDVIRAAHEALDRWGFGLSSVRFICGTQEIHRELEERVSAFLGTEETILFSSCFDANGGLFEPILDAECALITDALNHASLIDGARLCKAKRFIYAHADMADLEAKLREAAPCRRRLIVTDGVFSMDGDLAKLPEICRLADAWGALVAVDDSHATGFIGAAGRGTIERHGVSGRVDVITTTFGKALGGASGGCVSGRREIIDVLRQRSRPYLFSNSLAPVVAATTVAVIDLLSASAGLRDQLRQNTEYFRQAITAAGFEVRPGEHPIVPIMLHDEALAGRMADRLLEEGIYVIGFSYPVVPRGQARIRVQLSALHTRSDLETAVAAFTRVGRELGVIA